MVQLVQTKMQLKLSVITQIFTHKLTLLMTQRKLVVLLVLTCVLVHLQLSLPTILRMLTLFHVQWIHSYSSMTCLKT